MSRTMGSTKRYAIFQSRPSTPWIRRIIDIGRIGRANAGFA